MNIQGASEQILEHHQCPQLVNGNDDTFYKKKSNNGCGTNNDIKIFILKQYLREAKQRYLL